MDTPLKHESLHEWLTRRGLPGLPVEPRREITPRGENVLHHPDGCPYDAVAARAVQRPGPEGTPSICGCLFGDILAGADEREFLAALSALFHVESLFQRATNEDPYLLNDAFPQLRRLVLRHHRWYAEDSYPSRGLLNGERLANFPALAAVANDLGREWDEALTANRHDRAALDEEIVRYATRQLMSLVVLRRTVGLRLPLMNALQNLVWSWLARPVTGTLVDEYFSANGEETRLLAVDPIIGSGFSLGLLDEFDTEAARMLGRSAVMACHLGGPGTRVLETHEGLRPILVWDGIRAQAGSVGFGEYPQILCEWFASQAEQRKRDTVRHAATALPGGAVVPVCESPGLDDQQWETALVLWNESFDDDKDDPGPYRDQATAIRAAASL